MTPEDYKINKELLDDFKEQKGCPAGAYKDHVMVIEIEYAKDLLSAQRALALEQIDYWKNRFLKLKEKYLEISKNI